MFSEQAVERSLRMSWATLLLLSKQVQMCEDSRELARTVAAWASIQTYYAAYHSAQALIMASGQDRPTHHSKTQSQYAALWLGRKAPLAPWSFGYGVNGSVNHDEPKISPSNISTFEDRHAVAFASMALRTTWTAEFDLALKAEAARRHKERNQKWKREIAEGVRRKSQPPWGNAKSTRLSADAKEKVGANLGPATLLHYLSRLRMRANYVGPDMFFDGPLDESDGIRFVTSLRDLAVAFVGVHERRIAHEVGSEAVQIIKNRWEVSNS